MTRLLSGMYRVSKRKRSIDPELQRPTFQQYSNVRPVYTAPKWGANLLAAEINEELNINYLIVGADRNSFIVM
jgi:hypothetical protein